MRPRTRSRARLPISDQQESPEPETEKETSEEVQPRGRATIPRRRITRPRSSAPVFQPGSTSATSSRSGSRLSSRARPRSGNTRSRSRVINQRLRIRGGARSTAAPVQVSQVDETFTEGKADTGVVTTEMAVVTNEATVVTINPTVVTTQESSLNTDEDPLVKAEDVVVKLEHETEKPVVTTEHTLLTIEETTFSISNDFVDETSQKPAEETTEAPATKAAKEENKETERVVHNHNHEPKEVENDEEEISTLRPRSFKPKFGADTRNKLREKLQRQLEESKKKKNTAGDGGADLGTDDEESDPFDSAFSDFDLTSSQQDLLTVKVAAPEPGSGRQLTSRRSERRPSEVSGPPRRRRLTQDYANVELYRVGRSTHEQIDSEEVTDEEQAVAFQPQILKLGHQSVHSKESL